MQAARRRLSATCLTFGGASWAPDDTIVFVPVFSSGLWKVPATGGKPIRLTTPDAKQGEVAHLWPEVLPGGKEVLFTVLTGIPAARQGGSLEEASIDVLSLETGERRLLVQGGFHARYAPSRHLVYGRGNNLMAAPFDLRHLKVAKPAFQAGKPTILFSGLYHYNIVPNRSYDVAPNGRFIMVKEQDSDTAARQINVVLGWSEELRRLAPTGNR
ncbi:MAG: hypothetical protein WBC04_20440 [Candidatus Acidiferrales bacterium]